MTRSKINFRGQAFAKVLGFAAVHWRRQPRRIALIMALFFTETVADILTPFFAGHLVEAVASGAATNEIAWNAAVTAFLIIVALGVGSVIIRQLGFQQIIGLTLRMMSDIAKAPSTGCSAFRPTGTPTSFAGSTVRKITRGMWAPRSAQRRAADRAVAVAGDAGRHDGHAGLVLAGDGSGRRPRLDDLHRRHRRAVDRLRRAGGEPCQRLGHPHGRRAGRCRIAAMRWSRALAPRTARKRGCSMWSASGASAPRAPGSAAR